MELELFRHDVMQTGTCGRGTMAILPMEEKKTQKVALGDYNGVIQAFSVKKGEIASSFKTLPTPQQKVKGLSRKGKEFFRFDTSITESIRKVSVHDKLIWTSAEYVHNQFVEGKDKAFYLAPDRINDAELVPLISKDDWSPVLACQDHQIRVMTGPNVFYQVATAGAPVSVRYVTESHDPGHRFPNARELLGAGAIADGERERPAGDGAAQHQKAGCHTSHLQWLGLQQDWHERHCGGKGRWCAGTV
ncbi:Bardet-Biedl syndrome 7 protein, partial [Haematococcus lacustris]